MPCFPGGGADLVRGPFGASGLTGVRGPRTGLGPTLRAPCPSGAELQEAAQGGGSLRGSLAFWFPQAQPPHAPPSPSTRRQRKLPPRPGAHSVPGAALSTLCAERRNHGLWGHTAERTRRPSTHLARATQLLRVTRPSRVICT